MKKITCILLSLAMICSLLVLPTYAQTEKSKTALYKEPDKSYYYELHNDITVHNVEEDDVKSPIGLTTELPCEDELESADTVTISDNLFAEILEDSGFTRMSGNKFYREEIEYVESVNLNDSGISDLGGIQHFTNLTYLSFDFCRVTSISNVKSLTNLTYLSFVGNYVTSISELSSLTNLEYLDVSYNELSSISAVSNMKKLLILSAQLSPKITALPTLTNCKNLRIINMNYTGLTSLSKISGLTQLELASFASCNMSGSLPSLEDMDNLILLDVSFNDINSISNVAKLTKLQIIDFSCNAVTDISPLSSLKELTVIRAFNNTIRTIAPLSQLSKLQVLIIASTKFTEDELSVLKEQGTNIKNIENRNLVADLLPLSDCSELYMLDITGNGVGDITPLLYLKKLAFVMLENNNIDPDDKNNQDYLKILQEQTYTACKQVVTEIFDQLVDLGYVIDLEPMELYETPVFGEQQVAYRPATSPSVSYTENGAVLSWTAAVEISSPLRTITGYQILRCDTEDGRYDIVGTVDSRTVTSWTDKTVETGKTYYYRIRAYKTTSVRTLTSACTQTLPYTHGDPIITYSYGDLNGSGSITSEDALIALKASVGIIELNTEQKKYGDVNSSNDITSEDALLILKYSVGIIDEFHVQVE